MSKSLERRYLTQPITIDGEETPKIRGYAAVFNSPSGLIAPGFIEKFSPNAFDDTLDADVRALFNHDPNAVLGRTAAGTLRLSVDATGLAYEIDPPDTQIARDLVVSMRRGDVDQSSLGMVVIEDEWDYSTKPVIRTVLKASLFDVSPVTYPAYSETTSEARCFPDGVPAHIQDKMKPAEVRSDDSVDNDGTDDSCTCQCPECQAGDCADCSDDPCTCEGCKCNEYRAMVMKLKLAAAF